MFTLYIPYVEIKLTLPTSSRPSLILSDLTRILSAFRLSYLWETMIRGHMSLFWHCLFPVFSRYQTFLSWAIGRVCVVTIAWNNFCFYMFWQFMTSSWGHMNFQHTIFTCGPVRLIVVQTRLALGTHWRLFFQQIRYTMISFGSIWGVWSINFIWLSKTLCVLQTNYWRKQITPGSISQRWHRSHIHGGVMLRKSQMHGSYSFQNMPGMIKLQGFFHPFLWPVGGVPLLVPWFWQVLMVGVSFNTFNTVITDIIYPVSIPKEWYDYEYL